MPRFTNILSGDMSLVGPRPLTPRNLDHYSGRMKVEIASHKSALETGYRENRGTSIDVAIILMTAWVVLFPRSKLDQKLFGGLPEFKLDSTSDAV